MQPRQARLAQSAGASKQPTTCCALEASGGNQAGAAHLHGPRLAGHRHKVKLPEWLVQGGAVADGQVLLEELEGLGAHL